MLTIERHLNGYYAVAWRDESPLAYFVNISDALLFADSYRKSYPSMECKIFIAG